MGWRTSTKLQLEMIGNGGEWWYSGDADGDLNWLLQRVGRQGERRLVSGLEDTTRDLNLAMTRFGRRGQLMV